MQSGQAIFGDMGANLMPLELVDRSIGKVVRVITEYGYEHQGILRGIDPAGNCVLEEVLESRPNDPSFVERRHGSVLINGASISIVCFIF
jgi:small nuclear ribonucleoprotein (snRNP)-like protein